MTVKMFNKQGKLEKTMETQPDRLYPGSSTRFLADAEGLQGVIIPLFCCLTMAMAEFLEIPFN